MKTTLDWKKFEPLFGTWASKIKPFFDEGGFDPVYTFLRAQSQAGKQIAPASMNTYRAFIETPIEDLKAVIVCEEPYSKFVGASPVASGVGLDCSITARVQPELQNFFNGIETDMFNGLNLNYINDYDLNYLSSQGVLIINTAFTVEKDKPGSHLAIWDPFIVFLLFSVIASTGVPVLLLGKTQKYEGLITNTNPVYKLDSPSPTIGVKWDTKDTFTQISKNIYKSNKETILWLNIDAPF
jgi:uracil-DNA glycosylase